VFVEDGVSAGEPVLVALPPEKLEQVRAALATVAGDVHFEDMSVVGRNPGRILGLFWDWSQRHNRRVRCLGEPIWPGRNEAETLEGQRHEALINLAFKDTEMTLLCMYDGQQLGPDALAHARTTHPSFAGMNGAQDETEGFGDQLQIFMSADRSLSAPPQSATVHSFERDLYPLRQLVAASDATAGLTPERTADFVFAINEAAENVIKHGRWHGTVRLWRDGVSVVGEVCGGGCITDPFAGRYRPPADALSGRGLWLINQLCDLVQLRSTDQATTVRIHMQVPSAP
jgi:anti-sigma regulatory factor (Ser/Thr protein kinase)